MAILNLAVNARDAMPDGGTLTISADVPRSESDRPLDLPAGRYIRLSITDTGEGMDDSTLSRATEPFFSTKGVGKGTGLGLSMVHGLASQLGGVMNITSQRGIGTRVDLWLPQTEGVPESHLREADSLRTRAPSVVLLVDDEDVVRSSTADMLADLGYQVIEASSAQEALNLADGGPAFDLLVTDHLMLGLTGTELARKVRAKWPDRPVLVISGFAEADGIAPDLARLNKPFRQAELARALAEAAGGARA